MKKLLLAVLVVVGGVLWLLPGRGSEQDGGGAEPGRSALEAAAPPEAPGVTIEPGERPAREQVGEVGQVADESAPVEEELPAPGVEESSSSASFHGQVFDALTQRPMAGVRAVIARAQRKVGPEELAPEEIAREAVSDVEGRFELALVSAHGVDLGTLLAEGYGPARFLADQAHASRATAAVLELLPAAALEVDVTDVDGQPLRGAMVALVGPSENLMSANSAVFASGREWEARTDATGRARFPSLPAEVELAWTVLREPDAGRAGRVALAPGETRSLAVVLGSDARVFGHVRDEQGSPVAGLDLWLAQADAADRRARAAVAKTRSDESGRFEFAGVPYETLVLGPAPGAQEFMARGHEVVFVDRPIVERDLVVERGLFLSGRVTGNTAEIEELAFLNVQHLDGTYVDSATLDGASFRIGPLRAGEYLLSGADAHRGTAVVRVAAGASDVELPMLEQRELRLSIQGSGGPFELRVRDVSRGPIWMWTETAGTSILPLVPGRYALLVSAPGDLVGYLAFEVGEHTPSELALRLEPAARCTFVHRASEGTRTLRFFVDGAPYVSDHLSESALPAGAARSLLLPPRPLVAELCEGTRVVARETLAPRPGERLRVELVPR